MIQVGVEAAAGEKVLRCLVLDFQAGGTWLGRASRLPGLLGKRVLGVLACLVPESEIRAAATVNI